VYVALAMAGAALVGSGIIRVPDLSGGSVARLAYGLDGDIYVADWDGTDPVRIADGVPPDGDRACGSFGVEGSMWSPDGRYLAYRVNHWGDLTGDDGCGPGTVHIVDAEGNPVATVAGTGWIVSWSPDSTRFATWIDLYQSIGIYGIDGERQALLLPGRGVRGDFDPMWSPDGTAVLLPLATDLDDQLGSVSEVWELPIDGAAPRRLPDEDPRSHWTFRFSPDGSQVAFVDDMGALVRAAADGSGSRVVATGLVPYLNPVWSPEGDRIAFSWHSGSPHELGPGHEVRVVEVASGVVTSLATDRGAVWLFVLGFSPEGDRVLFASSTDAPGADAIWSAKADGSGTQRLLSGTHWGDWRPARATNPR
jgi:Tol biopolymer transport system component